MILAILPNAIPVTKIVKLHKAGNWRLELYAPNIQKVTKAIYKPEIALKIFNKFVLVTSISYKKGIVWFGKIPYPKETKNTPIATNTKKKDSFFIYFSSLNIYLITMTQRFR